MIYDSLDNLSNYLALRSSFDTVLKFIGNANLSVLENGRVNLSAGVCAIIDEYETKDGKNIFLECHRKKIDIQIVLDGAEQIGICNRNDCQIIEPYNKETDCELLAGAMDLITLKKGYFAIFYPQDGHAPGLRINGKKDKIKKIVFKIPV